MTRVAVIARILPVLAILVWSLQGVSRAENALTLDLSDYELTFEEDFDRLDVSAWGPGTRWIAHTPWNGDFGDAAFADPRPGFPFTVKDGVLAIEARKDEGGKWASGLLASVDGAGRGFSQRYGYFEMRAKFPKGEGTWPAFWLIGLDRLTHTSEVDVVEHYGHFPGRYTASVHVWDRKTASKSSSVHHRVLVAPGSLYDDYNTFGAKIDADWIIFYFNRQEVWRQSTPEHHKQPMYLLVDLGVGAGWPTENTPDPSVMLVDYVKVWARED
ncbi:hypothetical protein N825_21890 [Skermanella stibiiresistens SB22]|uniref:GH16 domain-containing protein n=1 Tax=Skermanella stibiiresistens SB22 TaxID=1385369 RepID=W9GWT7_9PROT|nr:glycoside hydrolase family 16 protein [Skermanella stibiiresistens]EWY37101.1 hypothetical protein N825_21890 [Skermanella stibiiresistens SB22]